MKRLTAAIALTVVVACGGGSPSSPAPPTQPPAPPPSPQPSTFTLSGTVTESAPTTATRIPGAIVEIADGTHAGKSATAAADGTFSIAGLNGGMTIRTTAQGYEVGSQGVDLNQNRTLSIGLRPNPQTLNQEFTGPISGGDSTCSDGTFTKPCRIISLPIHHGGTLQATMDWTGSADLDLSLWRSGTMIVRSTGVGSSETVSTGVSGGFGYELHVTYYQGSTIANYRLRVTRPN